jgi:hypothetical protein
MLPRFRDIRPRIIHLLELATTTTTAAAVVVVDGTSPDYHPPIAWTAQISNNRCILPTLVLAIAAESGKQLQVLWEASIEIIININNNSSSNSLE